MKKQRSLEAFFSKLLDQTLPEAYTVELTPGVMGLGGRGFATLAHSAIQGHSQKIARNQVTLHRHQICWHLLLDF